MRLHRWLLALLVTGAAGSVLPAVAAAAITLPPELNASVGVENGVLVIQDLTPDSFNETKQNSLGAGLTADGKLRVTGLPRSFASGATYPTGAGCTREF